jgi:hypothetical protein
MALQTQAETIEHVLEKLTSDVGDLAIGDAGKVFNKNLGSLSGGKALDKILCPGWVMLGQQRVPCARAPTLACGKASST